MEAAFKPEVNGELDTQNFEKFEEVLIFSVFNGILQIPVLLGICTLRSINDLQYVSFSVSTSQNRFHSIAHTIVQGIVCVGAPWFKSLHLILGS